MILDREREIRAVTHRTRRRERPGQNHTHTHTGLESRPIHDHQRNATNEKRKDLQNGTTSFCRLFFSYRASQTKKAPQSRFESREGLPACLRKVCLFLLRRIRTSSKVRCVLKRVNFARSERIAFLYFSTDRSLLF